jgi:hypothetical protein
MARASNRARFADKTAKRRPSLTRQSASPLLLIDGSAPAVPRRRIAPALRLLIGTRGSGNGRSFFCAGRPWRGVGSRRYLRIRRRRNAMLMRFVGIICMVSLVACASPQEQARQQPAAGAIRAGEPVAGNRQALEAWWPVRFANENQCIVKGYQAGTDAFDQCVKTATEQQLTPHRPEYFRSLD